MEVFLIITYLSISLFVAFIQATLIKKGKISTSFELNKEDLAITIIITSILWIVYIPFKILVVLIKNILIG